MWLLIHAGISWQDVSQYLVSNLIDQYGSPDRVSKTTKLFHSPDVRNLTSGALMRGRRFLLLT